MNGYQKRVWDSVIERDKGLSIRSGKQGSDVHHVFSRGIDGAWQAKNMLVLTHSEHLGDPKTGSPTYRYRDLCTLQERYGYEYNEHPWKGLWDWGMYTYGKVWPW